jgi:hypothetical protein
MFRTVLEIEIHPELYGAIYDFPSQGKGEHRIAALLWPLNRVTRGVPEPLQAGALNYHYKAHQTIDHGGAVVLDRPRWNYSVSQFDICEWLDKDRL